MTAKSVRNRHTWKENTCMYCGTYREKIRHPNNKHWSTWVFYDSETGEQIRKLICKTNQLIIKF